MGWLQDFSGDTQRRDARSAYTDSSATLATQRAAALAALNEGRSTALGNLSGGYSTATGAITAGADRARNALGGAFDSARGDITTQSDRAENAITGYLDPWVASGRRAQDRVDQYLDPAQQAQFFSTYQESPYAQFGYDMDQRRVAREANAHGRLTSGRTDLAASRVSQERAEGNLRTFMDQQQHVADLGGQYAERAGTQLAGIRTGLGTQLGALEQNRGIQIGGVNEREGERLGNVGYQYGADQSRVNQGTSQAQAGIESQYGQDSASNRISLGNSMAASRNVFTNNLLGVAGLAVRGFTPGPATTGNTTTAFGNIGSAIGNGWNALGGSRSTPPPTQGNSYTDWMGLR